MLYQTYHRTHNNPYAIHSPSPTPPRAQPKHPKQQKQPKPHPKQRMQSHKRPYSAYNHSQIRCQTARESQQGREDDDRFVFLKRYKIVPSSQKYCLKYFNLHGEHGRDPSKNRGALQNIKYKKIQKNGHSGGRRNLAGQAPNGQQINCLYYSKSNIENNQFQRNASKVENGTKVTQETNLTRASSNPYVSPYVYPYNDTKTQQGKQKQTKPSSLSSNSMINRNFSSSPSHFSNPYPLPSSPQSKPLYEAYPNPIPEQYESSQSKTNRNQSSISPASSLKSLGKMSSIKSARSIKSSLKSIKGSMKSMRSLKSSLRNSIFLPINSIRKASNPEDFQGGSELEGYIVIENYMELLNIVANYATEITENYQNTQDWQQLIFLTYKKYYLCRLKLFNALFYRNTLFFQMDPGTKLPSQKKRQLKNFMNSKNGQTLRKELFRQNLQIADSLRNIYNLAIQKSGNYINLQQHDNFTSEIYRLIIEEIEELRDNFYREPDLVKGRLKNVVRCVMAIAKLDRKVEQERELGLLMARPINMDIFQKIINYVRDRLV